MFSAVININRGEMLLISAVIWFNSMHCTFEFRAESVAHQNITPETIEDKMMRSSTHRVENMSSSKWWSTIAFGYMTI